MTDWRGDGTKPEHCVGSALADHRPPPRAVAQPGGPAAAESFFPSAGTQVQPTAIAVGDLILPDNTRPGLLPVFFEGRLRRFERRIGAVFVTLGAPAVERSAEGMVFLRGSAAVLLHGPALVRLAVPFRVERLPNDAANYWVDLRFPIAQFRLPLGSQSSR
jgi:hypothetical protein